MKFNLACLLFGLLLLNAGCHKQVVNPDYSPYYPLGTFSGKFTYIHKKHNKYTDTLKASLQLVLSTVTGFAITGDTTIHAASYGSFSENATSMIFSDVTYPVNNTPYDKVHLSGGYTYTFDSVNLKISYTQGDSLSYIYDLVKIKDQY